MSVWDYVQTIAVIGVVIYAAYYVTRLVAKTGGSFRKSANIKQIGSLPLGRDKSVALVEVGEHIYILGVSAHRVELLDKLMRSEFQPVPEEQGPAPEFTANFKKELLKRLKSMNGSEKKK